MARDLLFDLRRGGGSALELLYGEVSISPTLMHSVSTAVVLPAPTKVDLIAGKATFTQVAPTPAPIDGKIDWAYKVVITDRRGKTWEYLVGVPDAVPAINFNVLPRYFETRPPAFGVGPQGPAGTSATVAVGTTTSGPTPAVVNSGTSTNAVLDFTLAKGDKGDKGDNATYLALNTKSLSDAPSTYPNGMSVVRSSTAGSGWPYTVTSITTSYAGYQGSGWQIIKDGLTSSDNVPQIRWSVVGVVDTWTPFVPLLASLATITANGLMPAADKAKLDGMTPVANSKTFAALASTYPAGFSVSQVRAADGWPIPTTGTVVTQKTVTGNTTVAQWLYAVEGQSPQYRTSDASGNWRAFKSLSSQSGIYNVRDFGALGDGVTDDFNAIVLAVAEANTKGGTVLFPRGTYYTTYKDPSVEANQIVISGNGVTLEGESAILENFLIYVKGTYDAPRNIATTIPAGSSNVSTSGAHGYGVGDFVQLMSCVNAYTPDGGEWQLGSASPTSGTQPVSRYVEFQEIAAVPTTTTATFTSEVIYPTYRASSSGLNFPIAGITNSQIRRLNMVKNTTFRGITFRSMNNANGRGITARAAANLVFEGCRFESGSVAGALVKMTDSYNVRFLNCTSRKSLDTFSGSSWNSFLIGGGCQIVYFEGCDFSGEAQTIDFTPNNFTSASDIGGSADVVGSMSTMQIFGVYESTFNGCSDGVTSHPSTYMFEVSNSTFSGGSVGVRARSRASIVRDNIIHTSRGGVSLSSFVSDSLVSGNAITQRYSEKYSGFYFGVSYSPTSSEIMSDNAVRNLVISENTIKVTVASVANSGISLSHYDPPLYPIDEATKVRRSEIIIQDNQLRKCSIVIDKWVNGTVVRGNIFGGGSDRAFYILAQPNSAANQVVQNSFLDSAASAVQVGAVTITGHGYSTLHRVAQQIGVNGGLTNSLANTSQSFGYSGMLWDALEVANGGTLSSTRAAGAATMNIDAVASDGTSAVTVKVFGNNPTTGAKLFDVDGRIQGDDFQLPTGQVIRAGAGTPEGSVFGTTGSLYLRTDGGTGTTLYVKQGAAGTTGWAGK